MLISIQYLRGIAAVMVAYLHLLEQAPGDYRSSLYPGHWFDDGRLKSGVDIFFVISGFIMLVTSQRSTPGEFAVRRAIRIVPLYWLLTLAFALAIGLVPQLFPRTVFRVEFLIKSLLFIPFDNPGYVSNLPPLLFPGWTLNLEMYFYAIFALILFAPIRWRVALNGLVFFALMALRYATPHLEGHPVLSFYTSPLILEFWCGMLIGELYLKGRLQGPARLAILAVAVGFLALLFDWSTLPAPVGQWSDSLPFYMFPAALIVASAVAFERSGTASHHPWLLLVPNASYSIYLSHIFFLGAVRAAWRWTGADALGSAGPVVFGIISMLLVMLGGVAIYQGLEQPVVRVFQSYHRRVRERRRLAEKSPLAPTRAVPSQPALPTVVPD